MGRTSIHICFSCALVASAGCASPTNALPYDPRDRRIETGEVLPDLSCAPMGSIPDAFGCECSEGCASGLCLTEADSLATRAYGIVGGLCLHPCSLDDECEPGYACVHDGTAVGACFLRCEMVETCPPANTCGRPFGAESPRICRPLCQADSECLGRRCDLYTGSCGGMSSPTLGGLGAPCESNSQCRGPCLRGGFCSADCSISRQGCPESGICIDDGDGDDDGTCLVRCEVETDCDRVPDSVCSFWAEAGARGCL